MKILICALVIAAVLLAGLYITLRVCYNLTFRVPRFKEKDLFLLPP